MERVKLTSNGAQRHVDGEVIQPTDTVLTEALATKVLDVAPELFPTWAFGLTISLGDVYEHNGQLWEALSGHTVVADINWQPGVAWSLWTEFYPSGVIPQWRQPFGAHDAYPIEFEVWHGEGDQARIWVSLVDANVWEPGAVGTDNLWTLRADQEPLTPSTDEWAAGVAYSVNDEVTYQGVTYRCLQAHTSISTWQPPNVPALWQPI